MEYTFGPRNDNRREGSKAEERYLTEQSNQTKELEKLRQKNAILEDKIKPGQVSPSNRDSKKLNSFSAEVYRRKTFLVIIV